MPKTPMECLLVASSTVRKTQGLSNGAPIRLGDLKSEYFKSGPPSFAESSPSPSRKEKKVKFQSTPVTAPDKPLAETDIESRIREFKAGRGKA